MTENRQESRQLELTGPGRRLMEARCALNLSREDVARQLRLKKELIAAIEEDRMDELPAPIYVLGYLKNYARLLKLPSEPVIDAYQQLRIEAPDVINEIVKPQKQSKSARFVKFGSILVTLVLLAGFISWLQTQDFNLGKPEEGDEPAILENRAPEVIIVEPTPEQPAIDEVSTETTPVTAVPQVEKPAEPVIATPPEVTQGADDVSAEGDKIRLSLKEDCWVDIRDADDRTIIYDLLREGRTHVFTGKAPFSVFLGNARAVELFVNDKAYDVSPHIRGKLARFKIEVADSTE